MQDPFFQAKRHLPWGQHPGYVEDVYRTYRGHLPKRDPAAFNRAMQYRTKEKETWQRDRAERDQYAQNLDASQATVVKLTGALRSLTEQFSGLKAEHERTISDRERSRGLPPVRDEPGDDAAGSGHERADPGPDDGSVHGEVLSTKLPDSRGQASEHGAPGRHTGGGDAERSVPVREEPVPEGGEGGAGS